MTTATTKTLAHLVADYHAAGGAEMTADLFEAFRSVAAPAWATCPACTGHGLKDAAPMDAPTAARLCEACEGLGMVRA